MARVLEHYAKSLFKQFGIPVPEGKACASAEEARLAAEEIGAKVVIKALVPVGGRGKFGAVKFADTPAQAVECAAGLLGMNVKGWPCESVLVEKCVDVQSEYYASITFSSKNKGPVVIVNTKGGVDVEAAGASLQLMPVDIIRGLYGYQARDIWEMAGLHGKAIRVAGEVVEKMYRLFCRYDVKLLEINPLIETSEGQFVAADAVMTVDDEGFKRHKNVAHMAEYGLDNFGHPPTEREKEMLRIDQLDPYRGTARYVELGKGDIGFMCGGGGGSLVMMDTLIRNGAKPINYTEMGGGPTERKLVGLAKVVLSQPGVKGFLRAGNISSNTRVDFVAQALVTAVRELGVDPKKLPMVVRAAGLNEDEGRKILEDAGITYFGEEYTMQQAAEKLLEMMKENNKEMSR
ncbi:MAG: acetate--CoA ligase family protein [Desulfovibrio sp.]|jgi:succinyl-CoA synthetase beta subunit/citryl-CoA synthetase large subunit|nr:acetate--CoA ligase family protein [Desulfovibrio sp.]